MSNMSRGCFEGYSIMSIFEGNLRIFAVDIFTFVTFAYNFGRRSSTGYITLIDIFLSIWRRSEGYIFSQLKGIIVTLITTR